MNPIYKLLEDKNYWYGKYLNGNEAFLQALKFAPEVALDELDLFHGNRESLLKILEDLDKRVQECLESPTGKRDFSSEERTHIQRYIREKDSVIVRILELDKEIMELLDLFRADGTEKMKLLAKGKKALAKYKSSHNYSDKIDKRI